MASVSPGSPDLDPAQAEVMPGSTDRPVTSKRGRRGLWTLIPLILFVGLALLFVLRLGAGDPSRLPSALIDKPVPEFSLPTLAGDFSDPLSNEALADGVHVVNIWASWCAPCRIEHPFLMQLAGDDRFSMIGLNYKDNAENAKRFLGALGDPYDRIGVDRRGRTAIDWGVYGVPETFIVADGIILHKFIGPLSETGLKDDFMPALERALKSQGQPAS